MNSAAGANLPVARWVADPAQPLPLLTGHITPAQDRQERRILLFGSQWELDYFTRQNPSIELLEESPV